MIDLVQSVINNPYEYLKGLESLPKTLEECDMASCVALIMGMEDPKVYNLLGKDYILSINKNYQYFSEKNTRIIDPEEETLDGFEAHFDHRAGKYRSNLYEYDRLRADYKASLDGADFYSSRLIKKCKKHFDILEEAKLSNILTWFIYEIFGNTYCYARYDLDMVSISPNVRGIYYKINPYEKELQVYIIDSGKGMASIKANKDYYSINNLKEEKESLIKCFNIRSDYRFKSGLFHVFSGLKDEGSLRIRTGHFDLFRDFRDDPFDGKNMDMLFIEKEWTKGTLCSISLK